jgi:hypothetical protein
LKIGDLVQRKGTSEWNAIVTGFNNEHNVRIVWVDTGESDACSIDLLEVINASR